MPPSNRCRCACHQTGEIPVIRIDLASEHGQALLWRILEQSRVFAIHLGPPCGTSSRAREIKRRYGTNPKPLRSVEHPDGLPGLRPQDQARVNTANTLYQLCGAIMAFATTHGIICSLENPARTHMWGYLFPQQWYPGCQAQVVYSAIPSLHVWEQAQEAYQPVGESQLPQ